MSKNEIFELLFVSISSSNFTLKFRFLANSVILFKKIYANANLKIFNTLGEEVMVLDFETEKNNEMKLIDVSNLPNGVYFIVIHSGKNTDTVRISVQH